MTQTVNITDEDFIVAAKALADMVPIEHLKDGRCLPDLASLRDISHKLAGAVGKNIHDSGRSTRKDLVAMNDDEWLKFCNELRYCPA
jgi:malic enzyme